MLDDSYLQGALDMGQCHRRHSSDQRPQMPVSAIHLRFNHGADFQPLVQFNFAFTRLDLDYSNRQFVD